MDQAKYKLPRTMHELASRSRLQACLEALPAGHRDRPAVAFLTREAVPLVNDDGSDDPDLVQISVNYLFSLNSKNQGRLFAQHKLSHQGLCQKVRAFLCDGVMQDLDFENCFPRFLLQLFQSYGISCPALLFFVMHREEVIGDVLRQARVAGLTLTRDQVKKAFLKALHGGNYRNVTSGNKVVYDALPGFVSLDQFTDQVRAAADLLRRKAQFKDLYVQCQQANPTNPLGRFVSLTCQRVEHACLAVCMRVLRANDVRPRVNMFDGLNVSGFDDRHALGKQGVLDACMAAVKLETGFDVKLTEKVHEALNAGELAAWARGPPEDEYDTLTSSTADLKVVHARFFSHALQLDDDDKQQALQAGTDGAVDLFDIDVDLQVDLFLRGAWGTGKTQFLIKLIKAIDEITQRKYGRRARVLLTSSRKSLSTMYVSELTAAGLPAAHYSHIKGQLDVKLHPVSVWQNESLPRGISAETPPFDLVVCDEWLQFIGHIFQEQPQESGFKSLGLAGLSTLRMALSKVLT